MLFIVVQLFVILPVISAECGFKIDGICHYRETILSDINRPVFLDADENDDVYFGHSPDNLRKVAKVNLITKKYSDLPGIEKSFTKTVDYDEGDVYIGGLCQDVYKYSPKEDTTTFIGNVGVDFCKMYYKDNLYVSSITDKKVYIYDKGEYTLFEDLKDTTAFNFIIDNDGLIYFDNDTGLFTQKKGTKDAVLLREGDMYDICGLALNKNGQLHIGVDDGIYKFQNETLRFEKLFDVTKTFGLAIDKNDNIVYSTSRNIYVVKPKNDKMC